MVANRSFKLRVVRIFFLRKIFCFPINCLARKMIKTYTGTNKSKRLSCVLFSSGQLLLMAGLFPTVGLIVAAATAKLWAKGSEGQHLLKAKPRRCDGGGGLGDDRIVTGTTETFKRLHLICHFNSRFSIHFPSSATKLTRTLCFHRKLTRKSSAGEKCEFSSGGARATQRKREKNVLIYPSFMYEKYECRDILPWSKERQNIFTFINEMLSRWTAWWRSC